MHCHVVPRQKYKTVLDRIQTDLDLPGVTNQADFLRKHIMYGYDAE